MFSSTNKHARARERDRERETEKGEKGQKEAEALRCKAGKLFSGPCGLDGELIEHHKVTQALIPMGETSAMPAHPN